MRDFQKNSKKSALNGAEKYIFNQGHGGYMLRSQIK